MKGANFKRHKSFRGCIEGIKGEPHSDQSFGIKWHNIAEPAMNDWPICGNVNGLKVFQHYELIFT